MHSLFLHFNERYFWGQLSCVEVKWSKRMTLYVHFVQQYRGVHLLRDLDAHAHMHTRARTGVQEYVNTKDEAACVASG
jgi:hypothetical protein